MQHLILHIGRHKTGTTALQYNFVQNSGPFSDAGIHYPETGRDWVAQHHIATRISELDDPNFDPEDDELLSSLLAEIRNCGKNTVLISSEGFQRCNPEVVKGIFGGFEISVVVYIREQVSYLQSSYLQAIHAEEYFGTIEEYERDRFFCDYRQFLTAWWKAFSRQRIITRVFSRDVLASGDVVTDFFTSVLNERLGIQVGFVPAELDQIASNTSLKGNALKFKKRLNAVIENDHYYFAELYKALGVYSADIRESSNLVSRQLARKLKNKYRKSNAEVLKTLSLPSSLLDFPKRGAAQEIEWMGPRDFHGFLQMLIEMNPACGILLDDCYRVDIQDGGAEWRLIFCRNVIVDSLHLVKLKQGESSTALSECGTRHPHGYLIPKTGFNPEKDQLQLEFDTERIVVMKQIMAPLSRY